jgi:superfamily II DNA or RNA helicase
LPPSATGGSYCDRLVFDTVQIPTTSVRPGDRVRARRQHWTVVSVQPYEGCQLLTLAGADAGNPSLERRLLAPFDDVERQLDSDRLRKTSRRRWRRLCRAMIARHGPAGSLKTAAAARIDLLPHQLEPALAVLRGRCSRILLADEVGLGKTIQAGLILSELLARGAVARVLVLTPAGLRDQWARELAERFNLKPAVIDVRTAARIASAYPASVNPWSTVSLAIASQDYIKRHEVLPSVKGSLWDLVLVDEAHGVSPGSDRFEAAQALCSLASYVVLLTATPHNGDRQAFAALCRLGARDRDRVLVFRRRRDEVLPGSRRRIHRLALDMSATEARMHALLNRFVRTVCREQGQRDAEIRLALLVLQKRALSSAHSLARSVERRLAWLAAPSPGAARQLLLPLHDPGGELDQADEAPLLTTRLLDDVEDERRTLTAIYGAAEDAARDETKIRRLMRLLHHFERRGEPAIVFTEYRDTLLHLRSRWPGTSVVVHGRLDRAERVAAIESFNRGRSPFLFATDAAGEGLNLQERCRIVVNLELPWNPMRLEQRIGRVDRIGQQRTVHVFHLIANRTSETSLLDRLRSRVMQARGDFDCADPLDDGRAGPAERPHLDASESPREHEWSVCRLSSEAGAEHERLQRVRSLFGSQNTAQPAASRQSYVARSSRRARRSWLADSMLVLVESSEEDAVGRLLASYITALLLPASPKAPLHRLLPLLDRTAIQALDPREPEWRTRVREVQAAFWKMRFSRDDAIKRGLTLQLTETRLQPGLFDRRAERCRAAALGDVQRLIDALERRTAALAWCASHTESHLRPLLVLVPKLPD